jgi:hypothetical protein
LIKGAFIALHVRAEFRDSTLASARGCSSLAASDGNQADAFGADVFLFGPVFKKWTPI